MLDFGVIQTKISHCPLCLQLPVDDGPQVLVVGFLRFLFHVPSWS